MNNFTRSELITICEKAIIPEANWSNRDSGDAQRNVGEAWALLRAGCPYEVLREQGDNGLGTDEKTIWLKVRYKGFKSVEYGEDHADEDTFYLPTEARLAEKGDWY
jgi:hypothetical protein